MQPLTVLSLFDGMSCGRIALERADIPVAHYYASEIDKYAMQISSKNFPDIIQVGDVRKIRVISDIKDTGVIRHPDGGVNVCIGDNGLDLLIGGSPCQGFSNAGRGFNFEDPRSKLFFEFVRILNEAKPKYFLLENVKMKKEWVKTISEHLYNIEPVEIDSALVSAQRRKRLYRVGKRNEDGTYSQVKINQPEDRGILLGDILEPVVDESYNLSEKVLERLKSYGYESLIRASDETSKSYSLTTSQGGHREPKVIINTNPSGKGINGNVYGGDKSPTLTTNKGEGIKIFKHNFIIGNQFNNRIFTEKSGCLGTGMGRTNKQGIEVYRNSISPENYIRKLTPVECERLQTLPDDYTAGVSNTQRYKMIGNGWTVDVIAHIFGEIFKD